MIVNQEVFYFTDTGAAGIMIIHQTETIFKHVILFWVLCALNKECSDPTHKIVCNRHKMKRGIFAGNIFSILKRSCMLESMYYKTQHNLKIYLNYPLHQHSRSLNQSRLFVCLSVCLSVSEHSQSQTVSPMTLIFSMGVDLDLR